MQRAAYANARYGARKGPRRGASRLMRLAERLGRSYLQVRRRASKLQVLSYRRPRARLAKPRGRVRMRGWISWSTYLKRRGAALTKAMAAGVNPYDFGLDVNERRVHKPYSARGFPTAVAPNGAVAIWDGVRWTRVGQVAPLGRSTLHRPGVTVAPPD